MPVFYRGQLAHITHEVFEVRGPSYESFPIRELTSIHIVQGSRPRLAGDAWMRLGSIVFAMAAIGVAVVSWHVVESSEVVVIALLITTITSVVASGCLKSPECPLELWATFHDRKVCLVRTTDQILFGQISRALLRALECVGAR